MVTGTLVFAFSLMFVLAMSAMALVYFGIKEARREGTFLLGHWKTWSED